MGAKREQLTFGFCPSLEQTTSAEVALDARGGCRVGWCYFLRARLQVVAARRAKALFGETLIPVRSLRLGSAPAPAPPAPRYSRC